MTLIEQRLVIKGRLVNVEMGFENYEYGQAHV